MNLQRYHKTIYMTLTKTAQGHLASASHNDREGSFITPKQEMCLQEKLWLFIAALIKALKALNSPPDSQTISCGK